MFSIYSSTLERELFKHIWDGRVMYEWPFSVPRYSKYDKLGQIELSYEKHIANLKKSLEEYEAEKNEFFEENNLLVI